MVACIAIEAISILEKMHCRGWDSFSWLYLLFIHGLSLITDCQWCSLLLESRLMLSFGCSVFLPHGETRQSFVIDYACHNETTKIFFFTPRLSNIYLCKNKSVGELLHLKFFWFSSGSYDRICSYCFTKLSVVEERFLLIQRGEVSFYPEGWGPC